jgi:hypothetical protein
LLSAKRFRPLRLFMDLGNVFPSPFRFTTCPAHQTGRLYEAHEIVKNIGSTNRSPLRGSGYGKEYWFYKQVDVTRFNTWFNSTVLQSGRPYGTNLLSTIFLSAGGASSL